MYIYVPGLPGIARDLGSSPSAAALTVTTYIVGLGLGQLLFGVSSDRFGRRRPLFAGLALTVVASVACATAPSMAVLIGARFLQGAGATSGMVIARAVVRDLYSGVEAARYFSRLVLIIGVAPVVAPLVGGQLLRVISWREVFAVIVVFVLVLTAAAAVWLPETLDPAHRRVGGATETARAFGRLLRDRTFFGYALALGLSSGILVAYIAGAPFVIETVHGASPQAYGVFFGVNALGMIVVSQVNAHLVGRLGPRRLLIVGVSLMLLDTAVLVTGTIVGVGLWVLLPCLFLVMSFWGLIPNNLLALAMHDYPKEAGSAAALLGVFQFGLGGFAGLFVGIGGARSAIPMVVTLFGLALSAFCAVVFLTIKAARPAAVDPPPFLVDAEAGST
jgi:DHA1 family bicyclomycin/chloramphenicol resistance-like MFS transporter